MTIGRRCRPRLRVFVRRVQQAVGNQPSEIDGDGLRTNRWALDSGPRQDRLSVSPVEIGAGQRP